MQTLSFIGSDKNAGKTTALCYEYGKCLKERNHPPLCLTSIGINGELLDSYEQRPKPAISVDRGTYFITAAEHLKQLNGCYQTVATFPPPVFAKHFILAKARQNFQLTIEGPNQKDTLLKAKETLAGILSNCILFIDGSIDRAFIADPLVSDKFFFALLVSSRPVQLQKAKELLRCLSLPVAVPVVQQLIAEHLKSRTKSLLVSGNGEEFYQSSEIPFSDQNLLKKCLNRKNEHSILYLKGALSKSLINSLSPLGRLEIVLNNFTLYQNFQSGETTAALFRPHLSLLHPVFVKALYLNQQIRSIPFPLPENLPVRNIYRGVVQ